MPHYCLPFSTSKLCYYILGVTSEQYNLTIALHILSASTRCCGTTPRSSTMFMTCQVTLQFWLSNALMMLMGPSFSRWPTPPLPFMFCSSGITNLWSSSGTSGRCPVYYIMLAILVCCSYHFSSAEWEALVQEASCAASSLSRRPMVFSSPAGGHIRLSRNKHALPTPTDTYFSLLCGASTVSASIADAFSHLSAFFFTNHSLDEATPLIPNKTSSIYFESESNYTSIYGIISSPPRL